MTVDLVYLVKYKHKISFCVCLKKLIFSLKRNFLYLSKKKKTIFLAPEKNVFFLNENSFL